MLAAVQAGEVFAAPQMLNDGSDLLFTVATGQGNDRWDRAQIVVQSVGSSERKVIFSGGSEGKYSTVQAIWSIRWAERCSRRPSMSRR